LYREAAYTLTTYLESKELSVEFDPPSPFSERRLHRQRLSSEPAYSNLNRNQGGQPNPSGPDSRPDLDAEDCPPNSLTVLELGSGTGIIIAKLAETISQGANDVPTGQFQVSVPLSPCLKSGPSFHTDGLLIATDLDNVCPLLDENLSSAAQGSRVLVRPLEWGNPNHPLKIFNELGSRSLTHIICSDLVRYLDNSKKNVCLPVIFRQGLLPGSTSSSSPFLDPPHIATALVATTNYYRFV